MIPYAWMGGLALAVLWTNTILVAAAALKRAAWIRRHRMPPARSTLTPGVGVLRLSVREGRGPDGAIAQHGVEQRGRRFTAKVPTIGWHDRDYTSEIFGGTLAAEPDGVPVRLEPAERAEVWPDRSAQLREARLPNPTALETRLPQASKAKGTMRDVRVSLGPSSEVWVAGEFREEDGAWRVEPARDLPLIVSQTDVLAWGRSRRARLFAFAAAILAAAALLTGLCLTPPLFGAVSTVGGALALVFFLLVQPAGVWVRDQTAVPAFRKIEGEWRTA